MVDVDASRMSEGERELRTAASSSARAITFAAVAGVATILLVVRALVEFFGTRPAESSQLFLFGWTMAGAAVTLIIAGYWVSRAQPRRYVLTDRAVYLSSSRSLHRLMYLADVYRLEIGADPRFRGVASITLTTEFGDEVHLRDLAEPEAWAMQIDTLVTASGGHVKMPHMPRFARQQQQVDSGVAVSQVSPLQAAPVKGVGEVEHVLQSRWALKLYIACMFMILGAISLGASLGAGSSDIPRWISWWLAIMGGVYLAVSIIPVHRISLRRRFGLLGHDVVISDRKSDWYPLVALGDIDEIRAQCTDQVAENYMVYFRRGEHWTRTGDLEHGDRWALIMAERATQIQGREVPLDI